MLGQAATIVMNRLIQVIRFSGESQHKMSYITFIYFFKIKARGRSALVLYCRNVEAQNIQAEINKQPAERLK